jgi:hypothetical protein|tara:strand:+ start:9 stop:143 length:135 start_codon:yes stop_codon:yes gene_type:complete
MAGGARGKTATKAKDRSFPSLIVLLINGLLSDAGTDCYQMKAAR